MLEVSWIGKGGTRRWTRRTPPRFSA